MLKSMLRIAVRHLRKRKGYAVLNILGLTVGIACCLLIFEYVAYERSYESFNPKAGRIVRVQNEEYQNGVMTVPCASSMSALAPTLKKDFPEVEEACRLRHSPLILANDIRNVRFEELKAYYADPATVDIFSVHVLEGDAKTALSAPSKVLLSATSAKKYFGHEDPLGKTLTLHGNGRTWSLEVTGVFADYPANSHMQFDLLVSYKTHSVVNGTYGKPNDPVETSWGWTDFYTYILLREGANRQQFAAKMPAFIDKYYNNLPENLADKDRYNLTVMPLLDIHLYSHYTEEAEPNGDGQSVSFLFLIAFFIIAIAWINYINLSTARSLERAREVGVRKVLGAVRQELIRQFMLESLLLNVVALVAALAVVLVANPLFGRLTGRPLTAIFSLPGLYWEYFAGLFVAGTLLSGIYPALVLSRYQPVAVLKGLFKNAAGGQWLRKGLIVGQFAASIILIAGTVIVYRQVIYMRSQRLGVDIDRTLVLRGARSALTDSAYHGAFDAFKGEVLQVKGVKSITASSNVMGEEILWDTDWWWMQHPGGIRKVSIFMLGVDQDFVGSYGIRMVAGRNFSRDFPSDRRAVLLNETAVRTLGFASPRAALGQLVTTGAKAFDSSLVVGVIADFHNEGLQKAIQPLVLLPNRDGRAHYSLKIEPTDAAATIAAVRKIWDKHFPGDNYTYYFLDEAFDRQYAENERFGQVFALFALFAVAIACFGLLGLSAYNVLQRTKEIGIRKVLGASVSSLLYLLSRDFLVLVIAVPVTWAVMDSWLQSFAYRIGISWWVFGLAGLLAVLVAFVTVGGQAFRAAVANPVHSLRSE
ncbi:ABC transporter permease [Puia dinghuensis]|uniref:ABC transporter permease n=1 Tax=Puia dinghuensis TaxID=1792502 RepID=A0A8J2XSC0_9BACT|nr:ABC transporter permease [Puia dinghuensis]GGA93832.1 ABC transporter permease [Puia dinghuensis]